MPESRPPYRPAELAAFKSEIALSVLFVILTCGLYGMYWQYQQMRFVNHVSGEEKFHFAKWFLFTLLTCTLYHHYHEYLMGREIVVLQERTGASKSQDLPTLSVIISIFSFGIITDAIQQNEINRLIDHLARR